MRSISLYEKIELEFKGTVFQSAICLLDIDNDNHNELCICNTTGDLHVFKGIHSPKPWKINKTVGPVVVLCGGEIRDSDENLLCSLDTEGKCTLYGIYKNEEEDELNAVQTTDKVLSPTSSYNCQPEELRVIHQETLAPNARSAILEDIDGDGVKELIVAFTDRFVRIYKWHVAEKVTTSATSSPSKKITGKNKNEKESRNESVRTSLKKESFGQERQESEVRRGLSFSLPQKSHSGGASLKSYKDLDFANLRSSTGSFVVVRQYSLFSQVGSVALPKLEDGSKQLIVSQPNGGFCVAEVFTDETSFNEILEGITLDYVEPKMIPEYNNPFQLKHSRNYNYTSTEVIGAVKRGGVFGGVIGICTNDGNFMILEDTSNGLTPKQEWEQAEHRWFSMAKFDVTNDGDDEIVVCSMNGMTYMIDKIRNIVSYNFNENVSAFIAGPYGPLEPNNVSNNCLCYVTLNGKIHVYYNVWISAMKVKCVHGAIIEKLKQSDDLKHILDGLKLPTGEIDHKKIQMLVKNTWSEKH